MATHNITQLRRLVFRTYDTATSSFKPDFTLEPDDLGQDTIMTFNIAPRLKERSTQMGTSNAPIPGTFDNLSATVTFQAADWSIIGKAIRNWKAAAYADAKATDGQIVGDSSSLCDDAEYMSVIAQGVCDDGSAADVEFTRCIPSLDSDLELGNSSDMEVELNLHPQIYNSARHSGDGYPAYTYRMGVHSTTTNERLNAATGEYAEVTS